MLIKNPNCVLINYAAASIQLFVSAVLYRMLLKGDCVQHSLAIRLLHIVQRTFMGFLESNVCNDQMNAIRQTLEMISSIVPSASKLHTSGKYFSHLNQNVLCHVPCTYKCARIFID